MGRMDDMDIDNIETPTPCQSCGKWFDLHDGTESSKWYPGTVICEECGDLEEEEINIEEEMENCQNEISNAEWTIKDMNEEIERLKVKKIELEDKIEKHRYDNQ